MASISGEFWLSVSAMNRAGARVAAGDEANHDLELDTEPREVAVPPDFAEALNGDPDARRFFDGLSSSNRRRLVLQIEGAKTDETRRRRIARTVDALRGEDV